MYVACGGVWTASAEGCCGPLEGGCSSWSRMPASKQAGVAPVTPRAGRNGTRSCVAMSGSKQSPPRKLQKDMKESEGEAANVEEERRAADRNPRCSGASAAEEQVRKATEAAKAEQKRRAAEEQVRKAMEAAKAEQERRAAEEEGRKAMEAAKAEQQRRAADARATEAATAEQDYDATKYAQRYEATKRKVLNARLDDLTEEELDWMVKGFPDMHDVLEMRPLPRRSELSSGEDSQLVIPLLSALVIRARCGA